MRPGHFKVQCGPLSRRARIHTLYRRVASTAGVLEWGASACCMRSCLPPAPAGPLLPPTAPGVGPTQRWAPGCLARTSQVLAWAGVGSADASAWEAHGLSFTSGKLQKDLVYAPGNKLRTGKVEGSPTCHTKLCFLGARTHWQGLPRASHLLFLGWVGTCPSPNFTC